ncbi:hypothetical protein ABVF61_12010 [Roseibium sp. HPY-6]|uniref:hypothetical protein n=1 Tax=Roseibium sp. HPY-6 TaxID=3229852 RepID=UPI00338D60BE
MSGAAPKISGDFAVVSGIPAGKSGTGQLVAYLVAQGLPYIEPGPRLDKRDDRSVFRELFLWLKGAPRWLLFFVRLWFLRRSKTPVLLLHPQDLGFSATLRIIKFLRGNCWIYLLESSFFCVRSYNHQPMEHAACLRCLGDPDQHAAKMYGCSPFPRQTSSATVFVRKLHSLARAGKVHFLAQNERQAKLAEQQFGMPVPVVGLWTADIEESLIAGTKGSDESKSGDTRWDIVFHGNDVLAKGSRWALSVARHAPQLSFLFPFKCPADVEDAPENCSFVQMSWTSGLRDAVSSCKVVLSPSFWSASIEGALVKNIRFASTTAVAANATSFSDEIPEGVILHLDAHPEKAATQLAEYLSSGRSADSDQKREWLDSFTKRNSTYIQNINEQMRSAV